MARLTCVLLVWLLVLSGMAIAQQAQHKAEPGLTMLDDLPVANQIPLLDNRFRIDDGIQSITMVLFRRPGTASIILVRPDGSKIFYNTASQHNIRWHDAPSYDLIEITEPMPGPWQAIGRILPESKILVLTDVELEVDALPDPIMVGESFKLTARLKDGEQIVNVREFKDILTLQVLFISTNNKDYDNFGHGIVEVATFRDDGRGFDASARDGIFTGEIKLNFGAGEWIPKFLVKTPLYSRAVEQPAIVIQPAPVTLEVSPATTGQTHHILKLIPSSELVDTDSLLFQGQISYPDGHVELFSITEPAQNRQFEMENRGHGSYILSVGVFGQMLDGREFVLNLPEQRFFVTQQAREAPALIEQPEQPVVSSEVEPEQDTAAGFPWIWIILVNVVILTAGALAIWLVITGKNASTLFFWRKTKVQKAPATAPQTKAAEREKVQKSNDQDEILDLSLPDD